MKNTRRSSSARKPDAQALRGWLASQQMTTALGVVRKFPGESSHFVVSTENGTNEVLVDVELIPSSTRVLCRLGFGNDGVYRIPRENSEVAVILPFDPSSLVKDSTDFEGIIVGVLNTSAHADLADDQTIVLDASRVKIHGSGSLVYAKDDGTVEIRSTGGTATKLPTLQDFNDLRTVVNTHTHSYTPGPGSPTPSGPPVPLASPPVGTQVLKGE